MHDSQCGPTEPGIRDSAGDHCLDRFPHLNADFSTCGSPCIQAPGHRPRTPHQCIHDHAWFLEESSRERDDFNVKN